MRAFNATLSTTQVHCIRHFMAAFKPEIWGLPRLPAAAAAARQQLSQSHLQMVKQIFGVRQCTPTPILLAEFGMNTLPDQWLLCAAGFWNALASLATANVFRHIALDPCSAAISQEQATAYLACAWEALGLLSTQHVSAGTHTTAAERKCPWSSSV